MNENPLSISPTHRYVEVVAKACILLAKLSSALGGGRTLENSPLSPAVNSCLDTTYFLIIFLCRFLNVQKANHIIHPLKGLLISTFACWLEAIMAFLLDRLYSRDLSDLLPICALRNACLTYVFNFYVYFWFTYYGMQYEKYTIRISISPY